MATNKLPPGVDLHKLAERLWGNIDAPDGEKGCWHWKGSMTKGGYGLTFVSGDSVRRILTHRLVYEIFNGQIDVLMDLDHLCRNRACCNPAHLEPVTPRENFLRGQSPAAVSVRTNLCKRGHPLTDDNVYRNHRGNRQCKTCVRAYGKTRVHVHVSTPEWREKHAAAERERKLRLREAMGEIAYRAMMLERDRACKERMRLKRTRLPRAS